MAADLLSADDKVMYALHRTFILVERDASKAKNVSRVSERRLFFGFFVVAVAAAASPKLKKHTPFFPPFKSLAYISVNYIKCLRILETPMPFVYISHLRCVLVMVVLVFFLCVVLRRAPPRATRRPPARGVGGPAFFCQPPCDFKTSSQPNPLPTQGRSSASGCSRCRGSSRVSFVFWGGAQLVRVSPRALLPKTEHALPATHTHTHGKTNSYVWLVDARSVRPDLLRRARCGGAVCAAAR